MWDCATLTTDNNRLPHYSRSCPVCKAGFKLQTLRDGLSRCVTDCAKTLGSISYFDETTK